jgi:hypothetical protein
MFYKFLVGASRFVQPPLATGMARCPVLLKKSEGIFTHLAADMDILMNN